MHGDILLDMPGENPRLEFSIKLPRSGWGIFIQKRVNTPFSLVVGKPEHGIEGLLEKGSHAVLEPGLYEREDVEIENFFKAVGGEGNESSKIELHYAARADGDGED